MKIVLCQPAVIRFKWELKVLLTNLKELHFPLNDVVLLFASEEDSYARYFRREFGVQAYTYKDRRTTRSYIPSIRPYLWWQYLSESKEREQETYLYVDSDVLFRELPVVPDDLSRDKWYCADTLGYTSYNYVKSRPFGDEIVQAMNDIVQVTTNQLKAIDAGMGGAQWLIKQPTALIIGRKSIRTALHFISILNQYQIRQTTIMSWLAVYRYGQQRCTPRFGTLLILVFNQL